MNKTILTLVILSVAAPALVFAQGGPRSLGSPGQGVSQFGSVGGGLGGAGGASYGRPSGTPQGTPTYTPPAARTPGSTVGYVTGAYTGGTTNYGQAVSGGYNPSAGGYRPGYTSSGGSSAGNPYSSAPAGGSNPYISGNSIYSTAGVGSLPAPTFTGSGAMMGAGTPANTVAPTPTGLVGPLNGSTQQTQVAPVLPMTNTLVGSDPNSVSPTPAIAKTAAPAAPVGDNYATACKRFNEGQYSAALTLLENDVRNADAPLPSRMLYIAALVGDGQMSMASYQAVVAARTNTATFFKDTTLVDLYKGNPALAAHGKAVEAYTRGGSSTLDPALLAVIYCQLTSKDDFPSRLAEIHSNNKEENAWIDTLKATVPTH